MKATQEFTDTNFQAEVIDSTQPVLVDVWAPWCGPCRAVGPVIDELAEEYVGRARVGKLNVDDNPQTAQKYGVQSIPTVLVFKDGQVADRFVGVQQKATYQQAVDNAA